MKIGCKVGCVPTFRALCVWFVKDTKSKLLTMKGFVVGMFTSINGSRDSSEYQILIVRISVYSLVYGSMQ